MHLTLNSCVSPINRDHTSIFMNIKVCVKPIQNARILQVEPVARQPVCRLEKSQADSRFFRAQRAKPAQLANQKK
jgi:hypothetical protein